MVVGGGGGREGGSEGVEAGGRCASATRVSRKTLRIDKHVGCLAPPPPPAPFDRTTHSLCSLAACWSYIRRSVTAAPSHSARQWRRRAMPLATAAPSSVSTAAAIALCSSRRTVLAAAIANVTSATLAISSSAGFSGAVTCFIFWRGCFLFLRVVAVVVVVVDVVVVVVAPATRARTEHTRTHTPHARPPARPHARTHQRLQPRQILLDDSLRCGDLFGGGGPLRPALALLLHQPVDRPRHGAGEHHVCHARRRQHGPVPVVVACARSGSCFKLARCRNARGVS